MLLRFARLAQASFCHSGPRERTDLDFRALPRYRFREDRIQYTLDHLVPLEIGGADVIENIWPEPRRILGRRVGTTPAKDQLAALVCSSQLDVAKAQRAGSPTTG